MDEYLPAHTLRWCHERLRQIDFDPSIPIGLTTDSFENSPHKTAYIWLRGQIQNHWGSGAEPILGLSTRPTGAFDWVPDEVQEELGRSDD